MSDDVSDLFSLKGLIRLVITALVLAVIGFVFNKLGVTGLGSKFAEELFKKGSEKLIEGSESKPASHVATQGPVLAADEIFWLTIRDSNAPALFEEFLSKYPSSRYASDARQRMRQVQPASPTQPANSEFRRTPVRCVPFNGKEVCG